MATRDWHVQYVQLLWKNLGVKLGKKSLKGNATRLGVRTMSDKAVTIRVIATSKFRRRAELRQTLSTFKNANALDSTIYNEADEGEYPLFSLDSFFISLSL